MRLRKVLLVSLLALALPVAAASLAYACTALATLNVNSGVAPGQTVTGTGRAFNGGGHGTPAGATPVELRWNTRTGPLVATAIPQNAAGDISFSFAAPSVPAGSYVLIAVQTNPANGTPFYGTPARQSVTIVAGSPRGAERGGEASAATAGAQASTSGAALASASAASAAPAAAAGQPSAPSVAGAATAGSTGAAAAAATERSAPAAPTAAPVVDAAQAVAAAAADSGASASAAAPVAPAPDVVTTVTRALAAGSTSDGRSPVAALLLMGLGLGLVLLVSGRWLSGRLPGSR